MSWEHGGWGEKCQKHKKGKCSRRGKLQERTLGRGLRMPIPSDLQVTFFFKFICSPQTCEADILYFTDEEMETRRVNLSKTVMVETAHLAWEIYSINCYAMRKCREAKWRRNPPQQRKIRKVYRKDHSPELFFFITI